MSQIKAEYIDHMGEIWLPVAGYEGLYEVSSRGRVRSLDRVVVDKSGSRSRVFKGRVLRNICLQTGYHMVSLHRNNARQERRTVHRIVMETFRPVDTADDLVIDHIDGVRHNNELRNLRWVNVETNNRNTPYVRYLQSLLTAHGIKFEGEDVYES